MKQFTIDGTRLTIKQLEIISSGKASVSLSSQATSRMHKCRQYVDKLASSGLPIYGVSTGFGELARVSIPRDQMSETQENLVRSHACGAGEPLPADVVRAMLLLRANTLCLGHSGVRPEIVDALLGMINADVLPVVPSRGSVGASGDLAPLAHIALALLGEGRMTCRGEKIEPVEGLARAGFAPFRLEPKEGLALINGTQMMNAVLATGLTSLYKFLDAAHLGAALTCEVLLGTDSAYNSEVHQLRPHAGQIRSAALMKQLLADSPLRKSHEDCPKVQDAYSLRCIPQVHGAIWDTLDYAAGICETEMNSVTDNPLIFPELDRAVSGGNFHGQPVAFALDFVAIAAAELGSISERRTERMVNPALSSGLPPFLAARSGVESGLMIAQYLAAALVSENKLLASPASVDSIPTSGNQEDHVSMGSVGAIKLSGILNNLKTILAIEWLCASRAASFRGLTPGTAGRLILKELEDITNSCQQDRELTGPIEQIAEKILEGVATRIIRASAGERERNIS